MSSQKESQLTIKTDFLTGDSVTGLRSGANVQFSFTSMFNAMSGLSNLNQIGNPLGVPILEQPTAGTNNFRNIESAKGVLASITACNGISVGCNFTQAATGSALIADLNAGQYKFKTLKEGAGITLTDDGESITISLT